MFAFTSIVFLMMDVGQNNASRRSPIQSLGRNLCSLKTHSYPACQLVWLSNKGIDTLCHRNTSSIDYSTSEIFTQLLAGCNYLPNYRQAAKSCLRFSGIHTDVSTMYSLQK